MKKNRHLLWLFASAIPLAGLIVMANADIFPQAIPLAGVLMLACWGVHVHLFVLFLVGVGRRGALGRVGLLAIGLLESLLTVGLVLYACSTSPDQEFVQEWDAPQGTLHVEVCHLGMHDHITTQVFWGEKGSPFASGYHFQDHFRVETLEAAGDQLLLHNGVQAETLVLDLHMRRIELRGR